MVDRVSFPLQVLLDDPALGLRVVTGDPFGITVSWAHGIELEDPIPYLDGSELVLTTGQRLPRSARGQGEYVQRLARGGIRVIGFGSGVRFPAPPDGLVAACEREGVVLLEVPLRTAFLAVSRAGSGWMAQQDMARVRRSLDAQRRLTRAGLRHGEDGVTQTLSRALDRPVLLLDVAGVATIDSPLADEALALLEHGGRAQRVHAGDGIEVHPLIGRSALQGWLAVDANAALGPAERSIVQHAVALLIMLRDNRVANEGMRDQLTAAILDRWLTTAGVIDTAAAHPYGFVPGQVVRVIATPVGGVDLSASVPVQLRGSGLGARLLVVPDAALDRALRAVADAAGVSRAAQLDQIRVAAKQAVCALDAAVRRGLGVVDYDSLGVEPLLDVQGVREQLAVSIGPALDALDAAARSVVLSYLRAGGQEAEVARDLGLHRHTVSARLARVHELTNLDLKDPDTRALLWLALTADESADW